MTRIKHVIGSSPCVVFNLPSTKAGDNSILKGKVFIDIYGLKCSQSLSFAKEELVRLSSEAKQLYDNLKGTVTIQSECKSFWFSVSASSTGNIKIEVTMTRYEFSQPNNSEWQAYGSFYNYPECLLPLIEIGNEVKG